ncbi:MAG: T9SS type A sorting domain-containing protein [Bacteroidetes bacterium]|nr:T9SS type A sorting domain-containing protein [Bacteroidota bacterium]
MKKLVSLFFATLFFAGLSSAQTNGTLSWDGLTRNYIVYLPSTYTPGSSFPLVFVLHGFTQSSSTIMDVSGFNDVAEDNDFIAVYPNGVNNGWNTNAGFPGGSTADDIGFIGALIDEMHLLYNIDTNKVYSCGFSAGGYMSHRLACESDRCFAAIASVSGTMSNNAFNDCVPSKNMPVMQIHGTSDIVVNYNGGFGGKSVDDVINLWVANNSCPTTPVVTLLPDINTTDGSTVEQNIFEPCTDSATVILLKVIGGGHQWPGSTSLLGGIGNINKDIIASEEIWNFFSGYSCPVTTSVSENLNSAFAFNIQNLGEGIYNLILNDSQQKGFSFSIFDLTGKIISTEKIITPSLSFNIDLSKYSNGVYFLNFISESESKTIKLIR